MSQKRISLNLTEADYAEIDAALTSLEARLVGLDLQSQDGLPSQDALGSRIARLRELVGRVEDVEAALGSGLMSFSLEAYALLQAQGLGAELEMPRKEMSAEVLLTANPTGPLPH
jgi:hypothetical protein